MSQLNYDVLGRDRTPSTGCFGVDGESRGGAGLAYDLLRRTVELSCVDDTDVQLVEGFQPLGDLVNRAGHKHGASKNNLDSVCSHCVDRYLCRMRG